MTDQGSSCNGTPLPEEDLAPAETLAGVRRAFRPFVLPAGDPRYVNLDELRGDKFLIPKILREMEDCRSGEYVKYAYAGHRGSGKSTELLRLKAELQSTDRGTDRYFVIYKDAYPDPHVVTRSRLKTEHSDVPYPDLSHEDLDYVDILLYVFFVVLECLPSEIDVRTSSVESVLDWLCSTTETKKEFWREETDIEAGAKIKEPVP